ncbi:uncharacterized protein CTRU02_205784 [Colletotrichum truncatum]|uniref:Uncharacterized protein n=1 Tax=Colletotrichum truncatum TaxID=5467 RepID=A0ACC3Z524_COLTU|nr:uncharacterized protein CTRU02_15613 [Colletotrichum truncatum]KAF6780861.1 hypothetical protein CTRU02_15613 [Colletotrichum truncatum]
MDEPRTYFILRNTDHEPDRLIQLGQLIADPRIPYRRVAPPFKPIPKDLLHHAYKDDWSFETSKGSAGQVGVFAQFLAVATAETSAHASHELMNSWKAAALETVFLELGEDTESPYVIDSVNEAIVQKWLKRDKFRKRVLYMVTGVKIARQPEETSSTISKTTGASAKVGGDPGTGGLVSVGAQGGLDRSKAVSESNTPSKDFVFAYRLRKIHISLRDKITLGNDLHGGELHGDGYLSDLSTSEDDTSDDEMEETFLQMDDIDEVFTEEADFGSSLPATDIKISIVDDDGQNCLGILAV